MYLTISQYARRANVPQNTIRMRLRNGNIVAELIEGKKMIDTEKFPPLPRQKAGAKIGMKNALKKKEV